MSSVKDHTDFLNMLMRHNTLGERKKLLSIADKGEIDACCEVYLNAVKGNIDISPGIAKKLAKHKRNCQALIDPKIATAKKKKILSGQTGGFLPLLVGALAPLLGGLAKGVVTSILSKKKK